MAEAETYQPGVFIFGETPIFGYASNEANVNQENNSMSEQVPLASTPARSTHPKFLDTTWAANPHIIQMIIDGTLDNQPNYDSSTEPPCGWSMNGGDPCEGMNADHVDTHGEETTEMTEQPADGGQYAEWYPTDSTAPSDGASENITLGPAEATSSGDQSATYSTSHVLRVEGPAIPGNHLRRTTATSKNGQQSIGVFCCKIGRSKRGSCTRHHKCEYCGKVFRRSYHLHEHCLRHTPSEISEAEKTGNYSPSRTSQPRQMTQTTDKCSAQTVRKTRFSG